MARPGFRITLIDRHLLRRMLPRMGIALLVTLLILLMERVLKLIDLVTTTGAPLKLVIGMALNLVPHYLGLALPATFAVAVLSLLASLSRDSEIDVLESAGWSLRRIGAPFVLAAVMLSIISLPLFGVIQPYTRYAYRAIKHAAKNAGWTGRVEEGVFIDAGDGLIISVGDIDESGRILSRIFVRQIDENGRESVFTARRGVLVPDQKARVMRLLLKDGRGFVDGQWVDFQELRLARGFEADSNPFRPRGRSERELTFAELLKRMKGEGGQPANPRYAAEFHARLLRIVAVIGVAFLAIPLGVTRKRGPVWPRMALALVILIAFNEILLATQSLAKLGRIDPVLGVWSVGAVFMLGSLWLFLATPGQGAPSPLRSLLRGLDLLAADTLAFARRLAGRFGLRS